MKDTTFRLVTLLVVTTLLVPACGVTAPGGTSQGNNTIEIQLAEPVHFNEPVTVTITVQVSEEIPEFEIYLLTHDSSIIVEGDSKWDVHARSHQPIVVSSHIRFTEEGDFEIQAMTHDRRLGGYVLKGYQSVRITRAGGTINPPSELTPGTPAPVWQTPAIPTSVPQPTPTPRLTSLTVTENPAVAIPDDGTWLTYPVPVTTALTTATVVGASAKFLITHPRPQDLVIEVIGPDGTTAYRVWDRKMPTPEDFVEGQLLPRTYNITVFDGQPVNGTWMVRVRDEAPGEAGMLLNVSLNLGYLQPASSQSPPLGLVSSQESVNAPAIVLGNLQEIVTQTFEGIFNPPQCPAVGWCVKDYSPDGYERYWYDDNYRAYQGSWAAWPARGGTDGRDPVVGDDDYFNYMSTRMVYGPFDLSDALTADASFWLWREIEEDYDYIAFEVSHDGVADFEELARWSGVAKQWEWKDVSFNHYVGDDSVWVVWRFFSDLSITYDGPWVDNITLWKRFVGDVTASGYLYYYDRNNNRVPARFTRVHLYDADPDGSDDLLGSTTTDANGQWSIGPILNRDDPDEFTLDLYAIFELGVADSPSSHRRVTNFGDWAYKWRTPNTYNNVADGTIDFGVAEIPDNSDWEGAMWIFQDLRHAWDYMQVNAGGADPGPSVARWEKDQECYQIGVNICSSFFWPFAPLNGMFIQYSDRWSPDIVAHELGHQYMYTAIGLWYWSPTTWDDFYLCALQPHHMFDNKTHLCAWAEGWGVFLALAVNGDQCYDWDIGPCGGGSENLEIPTWPVPLDPTVGDAVEGRVAGALYDLFDVDDDGWDHASFGFAPIWDIVHTAPAEYSSIDFWNSWKASGNNKHRAVQVFYQNTIDYDTAPTIADLPDLVVLQDFTRDNAIDLWRYSSDEESADSELTWQIIYTPDPRCGVSIDAWGNVDIAPWAGWLGSTDVTIQVSDSIKTSDDTFIVNVVPVVGRVYLPIIMKNHPPPAPFVTIVLDAPQPDGDNGWYVSDVEVSFSVPPTMSLPPIEYRLNLSNWQPFTMPFTVTSEGENLVQIRPAAVITGEPLGALPQRIRTADVADEDILSFVVKVDKSLPMLTITAPQPITYAHGITFALDYQAADAYSGLAGITATLDMQPVTNGQAIDTLALGYGIHEFALVAQDMAGHIANRSVAFTVTATISGLMDLKHRLYAEGGIYGPGAGGVVQSLDAKLEAAQRNLETGLPHAATNNLQAFVHQVEAQTDKHITPEAARLLIEDAQRIIAFLSGGLSTAGFNK